MKYGFGRTAVQMACTLLALCLGIGLLRQERMRTVFSEERVTLPIIMYHSILKDGARQGKYVVSPEVLARDLDALRARGCETVTVRDLIAYTRDGAPLPAKPVMLTFDDGYYNNYVYAYPLLRQRGMRAVVSIIGQPDRTLYGKRRGKRLLVASACGAAARDRGRFRDTEPFVESA